MKNNFLGNKIQKNLVQSPKNMQEISLTSQWCQFSKEFSSIAKNSWFCLHFSLRLWKRKSFFLIFFLVEKERKFKPVQVEFSLKMDAFKAITPSTSVLKISSCLSAISKTIENQSRGEKPQKFENNSKEVEFLKNQCKSENVHVSLMSVQTFVFLVENETLELQQILTMFISMLPNSR